MTTYITYQGIGHTLCVCLFVCCYLAFNIFLILFNFWAIFNTNHNKSKCVTKRATIESSNDNLKYFHFDPVKWIFMVDIRSCELNGKLWWNRNSLSSGWIWFSTYENVFCYHISEVYSNLKSSLFSMCRHTEIHVEMSILDNGLFSLSITLHTYVSKSSEVAIEWNRFIETAALSTIALPFFLYRRSLTTIYA